tara:strand:+ start:239 stop:1543 length:1305 start_codon:yes stop_codon:yes gene_type:complete
MMRWIQSIGTRLEGRLGALGWSALIVFGLGRCHDVLNLVIKVGLGRWLKNDDFGAIEPISSALIILAIPVTVIFQIGVKSISRLDAGGRGAERTALLVDLTKAAFVGSCLSVAVLWVLQPYILSRLHLESRGVVYLVMGGIFIAGWWQALYAAVFQGVRRFWLMTVTAVASPLIVLVLTGLLVLAMKWELTGALLARLVGTLFGLVIGFRVVLPLFRGERAPYSEEKSMLRTLVLPMTVFIVAKTVLLHFDRLFVRNYLFSESAGYGAIVTIGQIPMVAISAIVLVIFPLAAAEHADGRDVKRFLVQGVGAGLLVTLISVLILAAAGTPLLNLWNRDAFGAYGPYVWIHTLAMGLHGIIEILASVEIARHRYKGLWWLAIGTAAMSAGLYFYSSRVDLLTLLGVITGTRALILVAMWWSSMRQEAAASNKAAAA